MISVANICKVLVLCNTKYQVLAKKIQSTKFLQRIIFLLTYSTVFLTETDDLCSDKSESMKNSEKVFCEVDDF